MQQRIERYSTASPWQVFPLGLILLPILLSLLLFLPTDRSCTPLLLQIILLLFFSLWHTGRYIRGYWYGLQRPVLLRRDSTQMRIRTMKQEYKRFDRILIRYSLIASIIGAIVLTLPLPLYYPKIGAIALALFTWAMFTLEYIHISWLRTQLHQEHWIPILDAQGQQIDRVALSQIQSSVGKKPLVRLILLSEDMVYLEQIAPNLYDTPLIGWQYEGEILVKTAQRLLDSRLTSNQHPSIRLLLTYQGRHDRQPTLTYLCVAELSSPNLLPIDCKPIEGKWWVIDYVGQKEMRERLTPTLSEELPYLKQTILLAQQLQERKANQVASQRQQGK